MSDSIMQYDKECFVTKSTRGLDRHHCFKGSRRKASERYGLWVWLRHEVHMALHDHCPPWERLEEALKIAAQRAFEANGGTREEFMRAFGANYLGDEGDSRTSAGYWREGTLKPGEGGRAIAELARKAASRAE